MMEVFTSLYTESEAGTLHREAVSLRRNNCGYIERTHSYVAHTRELQNWPQGQPVGLSVHSIDHFHHARDGYSRVPPRKFTPVVASDNIKVSECDWLPVPLLLHGRSSSSSMARMFQP